MFENVYCQFCHFTHNIMTLTRGASLSRFRARVYYKKKKRHFITLTTGDKSESSGAKRSRRQLREVVG